MSDKDIKNGILSILRKHPGGLSVYDILKNKKFSKEPKKIILRALDKLVNTNEIKLIKNRYHVVKGDTKKAVILRIKETFGIATLEESGEEIFIRGSKLLGALPNEKVLVVKSKNSYFDDSFEVVSFINKIKHFEFVGVIKEENGCFYIKPDKNLSLDIKIVNKPTVPFSVGDMVLGYCVKRGDRHSEMYCDVINNYGASNKANICVKAFLDSNGITDEFNFEVNDIANRISHKGIRQKDFLTRRDLRGENIFTIDSYDSLDLDDAVSLEKIGDDYLLGVHIADVSHYVKPNTCLDKEALQRATSIYYANKVIPMLPKELSNGICSLNPNEERLTFSVFLTLNKNGELLDYEFLKTVIKSRVKGIYSEINTILDNTANENIKEKYKEQTQTIFLMNELADILIKNKNKRNVLDIYKAETKYIIEDEECVGICERTRGKSECIIEEFMLMANRAAALAAKMYNLPFIYRIHEPISPTKAENLVNALHALGINENIQQNGIDQRILSKILTESKGKDYNISLNNIILRSMSKARYSERPIGHFGLALEDYAHFTSPIRRYPDLMIHRILSEFVFCDNAEMVKKQFKNIVTSVAEQSSAGELVALNVERSCEDFYKAEYMKKFVGEKYTAVIISLTNYGFYISLENTIEGLVHVDTLPVGDYSLVNPFVLKNELSGKEYKVGDKINVVCTNADVASGNIDFETIL